MSKPEVVASIVMTQCKCVETGECLCEPEYIATLGGRVLRCECECQCIECTREYTLDIGIDW